MVASGYSYYAGPPPPRWFKFTGDSAQPFGTLQVTEGPGSSKADPGPNRRAKMFLPTANFQDLYNAVMAGGTIVFTIVCDANNNITGFSWRRYTGTVQLSSTEVLLVDIGQTMNHLDDYVTQAVPSNLGEQIAELRGLMQIIVDRNSLGSGYPGPIEDAEEEELLKSG